MRYLLIVCLLLAGCASNPIRQGKIHKHQWDKDSGKCWICGVTFSPMKVKSTHARLKDSKQTMINAIMIESALSEPEVTILWERYKLSGVKDFALYLIKANPFQKQDWIYIDFMERVKVRTKILKRTK